MDSKKHSHRRMRYAYVLVHFGSNAKYFELELYFLIMLGRYAHRDIDLVYLYSEVDTPASFVKEIKPFVNKTIGFNDSGKTINVPEFASAYTSFNTLRTCDFMFAYELTDYDKICIVESDLVIMGNIDSVFNLRAPAILTYRGPEAEYNRHKLIRSSKEEALAKCETGSTLNGGVMVIEPSKAKFAECLESLPIIVEKKCKYPNEALFEYVNPEFNNLPVEYNLSHYHTLKLHNYNIRDPRQVRVFHFNETDFKHLDIVKDTWFRDNINDPKVARKYAVKRIPIEYFENEFFLPNRDWVNSILLKIENKRPGGIVEASHKHYGGTMTRRKNNVNRKKNKGKSKRVYKN